MAMARFRLTAMNDQRSNATEVSRLAHTAGHVKAASWSGAVRVDVRSHLGEDWCTVRLTRHGGAGTELVLYDGPMSGDTAGIHGNVKVASLAPCGTLTDAEA